MVALFVMDGKKLNGITLNRYGIEQGWCMWPIDFDPTWVTECSFFEEKDDASVE
jgi:hypothetical protein